MHVINFTMVWQANIFIHELLDSIFFHHCKSSKSNAYMEYIIQIYLNEVSVFKWQQQRVGNADCIMCWGVAYFSCCDECWKNEYTYSAIQHVFSECFILDRFQKRTVHFRMSTMCYHVNVSAFSKFYYIEIPNTGSMLVHWGSFNPVKSLFFLFFWNRTVYWERGVFCCWYLHVKKIRWNPESV